MVNNIRSDPNKHLCIICKTFITGKQDTIDQSKLYVGKKLVGKKTLYRGRIGYIHVSCDPKTKIHPAYRVPTLLDRIFSK